jgi:ribonuclease HI
MRDLDGMDYYLTTFHSKKLGSLERALLSALQSGAFISASEHARYDASKQSLCNLCQCEDDRAHWLCCPRFKHLREAIVGWHPDNIELPSCVVHHLMIPRLPAVVSWRKTLQQIQDSSKVFLFYPKAKDKHHLFMDGACTQPAHQCRLASWGIVSATTGDVVALGHLPGVTQTIDRAELTALVSTMLWTTGADLCAWSDSLSNINIAEYIQNDGVIPSHVENYDLWLQFHEALQLREGCSTEFRWIPSHVNDSQAGDPFESWVFKWNNIVDELVSKWNINRPLGFLEQHAALDRTLNWWIERSKQSKSSELACAEQP